MATIEELVERVLKHEINADEIIKEYTFEQIEEELESIKKNSGMDYKYFSPSFLYGKTAESYYLLKEIYDAMIHKQEASELEKDIKSIDLDMSWENLDEERNECADNVFDGLTLSLANKARVDIDYIAKICQKSKKDVVKELKGYIYQNPATFNEQEFEGYETSDEYLSGNMYEKLKAAKEANIKYEGKFKENIKAIRNEYPKLPNVDEIYITLGSPWVPTEIIDEFIIHLLGHSYKNSQTKYLTRHDSISGTWETPNGGRYKSYDHSYKRTWGTSRCSALRILENSLNMKKCIIYDTNERTKEKTINKSETALAQNKQEQMINEFKKWVWLDDIRKEKLLKIYEEKYGSFVKRKFDGSFLKLDDMNKEVNLYGYQRNAIARILFSKNVLLAHDVGSGKTYEMIVAGHELVRMGLSKKNMYVVPNNIVSQWSNAYSYLYPFARVLVIEPKDFTPSKKQKVLEDIKNNNYEAIIMAYSCFDLIPLSNKQQIDILTKEKLDIVNAQSMFTSNTNILQRRKESLNEKLLDLKTNNKDQGVCFDELNINRLFIDEAHNYKNIPILTKLSNCMGVNATGSKKCKDMLDKVHHIQKMNNGGGVVMATGTPITNSICEVYTIQKFLQNGELKLLELGSFDSWAGMFGETRSDFEIDVTTNSYRFATRFSKFHNLPELTNLLSSVADFHELDIRDNIPEFEGYTDIKINKTEGLQLALNEISKRADYVRKHLVSQKQDNMLKITTDGRKAALDLRLLDEKSKFSKDSKVMECATNVIKEYKEGKSEKTSQLVFCDSSTPKEGFNMYDELKRILIKNSIKESEIAYIHDATNEKQRSNLYKKVRSGEIRILIGSTMKLGLGVNVQDKLSALHHLDIPWRPADMIQREGRILRQGNTNKKVNIYRYVTEGSFDAYSWQLLETKQQFINDLLSSALNKRDEDDVSDTVLSYGEIKALAIGNPLIKERVEIINKLTRLKLLHNKNLSIKLEMEQELMNMPKQILIQENIIASAKKDQEFIKKIKIETNKDKRNEIKKLITQEVKNNVLKPDEKLILNYLGLNIKLPKDMSKEKPYIIIEKYGHYEVEMSENENGNLIRIDNFIKSFDKTLSKLEQRLKDINERKERIKEDLFKKDDTVDQINELNKELKKVEERLGLKDEK